MKRFNLQLSCPLILSAPQLAQIWLKNIFNSGLNQALLKRYGLQYKITNDNENGPVLVVYDINEQDVDKISNSLLSTISRQISPSQIQQYISVEDIQFKKSSNFDELIKKIPELNGIF